MTRLARHQARTVATLGVGYVGYYFCRSNLAVASPLLLEEYGSSGLDKAALGGVVSLGVLAYAVGKLAMGTLADFVGGRGVFLAGLLGSAAVTLAFGLTGGLVALTVAWGLNRLLQAGGWGALVKIAAAWFGPARLGVVMGVLALSYPVGDFLAKLLLGEAVARGLGWRGVFLLAAAVAFVLGVAALRWLRESPASCGLEAPAVGGTSVYASVAGESRPASLRALFGPLLRSRAFLCVCAMSFGLTILRESFSFWTPVYLVETTALAPGDAAKVAAVFPFAGGFSVFFAGYVSDRFASGRRAGIMVALLVVATVGVASLAWVARWEHWWGPAALIALIGAAMTGPYAFLSGAVAVDVGGRVGPSTAAGVADAVGYVGSALAGVAVGGLAKTLGWNAAFLFLAVLCASTVGFAILYGRFEARAHGLTRAPSAP